MGMIFSNYLMKSSSTTIKRNSVLNMLGRSCAMARNGVAFLLLKPMEALEKEV